jgi:alpha-L-fucosidase 2
MKSFFLFLFSLVSSQIFSQENLLWYNQPAKKWVEALPLGNGRMGAMVFGDPAMKGYN